MRCGVESGVQGGDGAIADREIGSGLLATAIDRGRMAARRRQVMEARFEKPVEDLRRAIDVTARLRAQLRAAETPLYRQALELEAVQRKRLSARDILGWQPWFECDLVRHLIGGPTAKCGAGWSPIGKRKTYLTGTGRIARQPPGSVRSAEASCRTIPRRPADRAWWYGLGDEN
jgi:hypothetical protein